MDEVFHNRLQRLRYRLGGEIGADKLSFIANLIGSRQFPKLQCSHLVYTGL
jgi:hypothetical protein